MITIFLRRISLVMICSFIWIGCKSTNTTASKYVGAWHYSFEWDGTEYTAIMNINRSDAGYTGNLSSELGSVDLNDVVINADHLTATYELMGYTVNFKGDFEGDIFNGLSSAGGYEFPMEATRKKE